MAPSQTTVEQLQQELAEAQAQLAQVKLQNTALETMIKVAEKQLKIDIRKKYGSKRSRS
jgi:phage shock protein A